MSLPLLRRLLFQGSVCAVLGTIGAAAPASPAGENPAPAAPAATVSFVAGEPALNPLAARGVALADFNGDGFLDAFVVNQTCPDGEGHRVYFGNGRGHLTDSGQRLANPADWQGTPAVGDLNGDGKPDVVTGPTVWLNDGSGRFTAHPELIQASASADWGPVQLADLNHDGHLDLVAVESWRSLRVYLNDGNGRLRDSGQKLGGGIISKLAAGDVDGNGTIDVITAGWRESSMRPGGSDYCPSRVWLNDGQGHLQDSGQALDEGDNHVHGIALGDVDGDGRPDLVMALTTPGRAGKVYFNAGGGRFRDSGQILAHAWAHDVVIGDFNGDGAADLFFACGDPSSGTPNEVWVNDGHGVFRDSGLRLGQAFSWAAATGDLNGDGWADVVVANLRLVDGSKNPPVFGGTPAEVWINTGRLEAKATERQATVTLIANAGVLIAAGGSKVLVDSIFTESFGHFVTPPAEVLAQMKSAAPPFDHLTALLVTHRDPDHFDPAAVMEHLSHDPDCVLIAPAQVVDLLRASPGYDQVKSRVLAIPRTPQVFEHLTQGQRFKAVLLEHVNDQPGPPPTQNDVQIFSAGGFKFLHAGDAATGDLEAWRRAGLPEEHIDVLILPWFTLAPESAGTGRRVVELLKPRAVLLVHIPAGAAAASQITPEATRGLPPVFLLAVPGETARLAEDASGLHLKLDSPHGP